MAETKEDLKAQLEATERRSGSRLTIGLSATAGGLAVALLVACIGGGLYIQHLENSISEQDCSIEEQAQETSSGNTYHITYKNGNEQEEETVNVDKSAETEMFIKKDKNGHISLISVADFKRGLMAMYIPRSEECYIASGVHEWMANASSSINDYENHNATLTPVTEKNINVGKGCQVQKRGFFVRVCESFNIQMKTGETVHANQNDDSKVNFFKASETPITDHSILPASIKPYCLGKPLYWVHKGTNSNNTEIEEGSRKKRCVWLCHRACYLVWWNNAWWLVCVNYWCNC